MYKNPLNMSASEMVDQIHAYESVMGKDSDHTHNVGSSSRSNSTKYIPKKKKSNLSDTWMLYLLLVLIFIKMWLSL